jgi:2-polyprenyl-6-hydroxyphenyl methylase/3-demethylubiquinone-9 3-methyltransferase
VTGVDPAPENIGAAQAHALGQGLQIDYRVGSVEALQGSYDLITCLEVVEHVSDTRGFVQGLADRLADDGLLILSTPNRTGFSRLMLITLAEGMNRIPKGTHDWDKFLAPEELTALLKDSGLDVNDCTGLAWNPGSGFHVAENKSLDYFITARRS